MILSSAIWVLTWSFIVPENPDYQSRKKYEYVSMNICIQGARDAWARHYSAIYPDYVEGTFSTVCADKKNYTKFRTITCDEMMNCEVK